MAFAGSIAIDIGLNVARIQKDVSSSLSSLKSFESGLNNLKSGLLGLAGVGSVFELIKKSIIDTASRGEELNKLSQKLGITVENLSGLQHAAAMTDTSFEDLQNGLKFFEKALGGANDEGANTTKLLKDLGVSATDPYDAMIQLADAFEQMEDGSGKVKVALTLMGRGGLAMIPFLNEGAEGIKRFQERAEELGTYMTGEQARAAEEFMDNLKEMGQAAKGLAQSIGTELIPAVQSLLDEFRTGKDVIWGFFGPIYDAIDSVMKAGMIKKLQAELIMLEAQVEHPPPWEKWFGWDKAKTQERLDEIARLKKEIAGLSGESIWEGPSSHTPVKNKAPEIADSSKVNAAADAMRRLVDAQIAYEERVKLMDPALSDYEKSLISWQSQFDKMIKTINDEDKISKSQKETLKTRAAAQYELGKAFMDTAEKAKKVGEAYKALQAAQKGLQEYQERGAAAIKKYNDEVAAAYEESTAEIQQVIKSYDEAGDLVPIFGENSVEYVRRQVDATKELIPWMEEVIAKYGEEDERVQELIKRIKEYKNNVTSAADSFGTGWDQGIKEFTDRTKWGFDRGKEIVNDFALAAETALIEMWEDPKKAIDDFGKYLLLQLKKWAAEALLNPIMVDLKGVFSTTGASSAGLIGTLGSTGLSLIGGGMAGAGISSLLGGSKTGGMVGGALGNVLGTAAISGGLGSGVATVLGQTFGKLFNYIPIIGTVLGSIAGNFIGELLGGKKRPPELIFGYQSGAYSRPAGTYHADEYSGGVAKGMAGAWDIAGIRIEYREEGLKLAKEFVETTDNLMQAMEKMGLDVTGFSNKFLKDIHLEGLSNEQIMQEIEKVFAEAITTFTGIDFASLQRSGETISQTIDAVIGSLLRFQSVMKPGDFASSEGGINNKTLWGTESGWDIAALFEELKTPMESFSTRMEDFKDGLSEIADSMGDSKDDAQKWRDALDQLNTQLVSAYDYVLQLVQAYRQLNDAMPAMFEQIAAAIKAQIGQSASLIGDLQLLDPSLFAGMSQSLKDLMDTTFNATPIMDSFSDNFAKWQNALQAHDINTATTSLQNMATAISTLADAASSMTNAALSMLQDMKLSGMTDLQKVNYMNQMINKDWADYEAAKKQYMEGLTAVDRARGAEAMLYYGSKYTQDIGTASGISGAMAGQSVIDNLATVATDGIQIQADIKTATESLPDILQNDVKGAIDDVAKEIRSLSDRLMQLEGKTQPINIYVTGDAAALVDVAASAAINTIRRDPSVITSR